MQLHKLFHLTEPEPVYNVEVEATTAGGGGGVPYVYASFPVDVVVYFHMQPSTIRLVQYLLLKCIVFSVK